MPRIIGDILLFFLAKNRRMSPTPGLHHTCVFASGVDGSIGLWRA
jgi:hypothetical protein